MARIQRAVSAARSLARLIAQPALQRRAFAAACEVDCWSEWEEEEAQQRAAVPATGEWGEREARGVQWVFIGNPGAQKRVYATRLAELLEVPYISMGTLVRQELNPRSSLCKKIANAVNGGELVPEDIIFGLLSKRLEEGQQRGETGFILDGIPRTRTQAEILDEIAEIDLVVNFKCVADCLVKRHFVDQICSHCGKLFDASNSESTNLNPCLATQTQHAQLISSAATSVKDAQIEKCQINSEQCKLLEEYYRKQRKLLDFQISGGPGETWQGLLAALHLQRMDMVDSSKKLSLSISPY